MDTVHTRYGRYMVAISAIDAESSKRHQVFFEAVRDSKRMTYDQAAKNLIKTVPF